MKSKFQIMLFMLFAFALFSLNTNAVYALENEEEVNSQVVEVPLEEEEETTPTIKTEENNDETVLLMSNSETSETTDDQRKEETDKAFAKLKETIDSVKEIKVSFTEEEITNAFVNHDYSVINNLYNELNSKVNEQIGNNITLVYCDVNVMNDIHDAIIYSAYEDVELDVYVSYTTNYERPINIIYADSDKHDADLDKKADQTVQAGRELITVDLGNEEEMNQYTEEVVYEMLDKKVDSLLKDSGFTKVTIYDKEFYNYYNDDGTKILEKHAYESFYLIKDNLNYGYLDMNISIIYKVTIPEDVIDEEDAYIEAASNRIKQYLVKVGEIEESEEIIIENYMGIFSVYKKGTSINEVNAIEDDEEDDYGDWLIDIVIGKDNKKLLLADGLLVGQNELIWAEVVDEELLKQVEKEGYYYNYFFAYNNITKDTFKEMEDSVKEKGYTVWKSYLISSNRHFDTITLTFSVGEENNNKEIFVLHKKSDGTYEEFKGVVKNGMFDVVVSEFSPFVVGLGDVVKEETIEVSLSRPLDNEPKTGNEIYLSQAFILATLSLGSIFVLRKRM